MNRPLVEAHVLLFLFCVATAIASPAQTLTTLLNLQATNSGPVAGLIQATDGNLYGTTYYGGYGTVFKITTGGTLTTLHTFDNTDGSEPLGVIQATDGNFYGTTKGGTTKGYGSVFKITPEGTFTSLYTFCSVSKSGICQDGAVPAGGLVQATNGDLYGTTQYGGTNTSNEGTVFKITTSGTLTTLYSFCSKSGCPDGGEPSGALIQAANGVLYGTTLYYGPNGFGVIFKITASGTLTVLNSFDGTDGNTPTGGLVQDTNGNFYGTTYYGGASSNCASNCGTVFQMTPGGTLTTLHSFDGTDGNYPEDYWGLVQASDGNLYGTTLYGGAYLSNGGTVFKITTSGTLTTLHSFCSVVESGDCEDGQESYAALVQHTNGKLYGMAYEGGTSDAGLVFTLSMGLGPFLKLTTTSGNVGSTVGILAQGFSSSSVVKFNGVAATKTTLTGTTYIVATVPTGATDGFVTVTTGATTLKSTQKFIVHNSWASGTAMPVAVAGAATGVISGKIYVVSGVETYNGAAVSNNQVYNPTTNAWTTATAIPTPVYGAASTVVSGLLYVIGGSESNTGAATNLVQIYNPKTNAWTTGTAMPTARSNFAAVVDGTSIYAIGGNGSTNRLTTVEKYVPSTNTWTEEAPLLTGVSDLSAGLLGTTVVAADGYATSGDLGTTESYDVSTNAWSGLTSDPNPRNDSCYGVISGLLYAAGGYNGSTETLTVNESFSATSDKWTSLAAIPTATFFPNSAVNNGQLYCFGGEASFHGTVINNAQIYQP